MLKLSNNVHRVLTSPITNEEKKAAIFGQGNEKAPGLDCFTAFFFKIAWGINVFVRGHCITDNTMLAYELMRGYGKRHISPRCAFKVDLQKAFDSLHWGFLFSLLRAQEFPGKVLEVD
ncbi:hypothetical protein J1N35_027084 [Gossypium stocksii]|uniref:Reverse transcriptase domain-containing protein n=1 Tax=Gossypium stocksii TaxID=47602 RepID=A0A9D3VB55_9ROSI|nr:hypothetical protein J1N35_027084 [Gossypium stocksii]